MIILKMTWINQRGEPRRDGGMKGVQMDAGRTAVGFCIFLYNDLFCKSSDCRGERLWLSRPITRTHTLRTHTSADLIWIQKCNTPISYTHTRTNTHTGSWNDLTVNEGDQDNTLSLSVSIILSLCLSPFSQVPGANKACVPLGLTRAATHTQPHTHTHCLWSKLRHSYTHAPLSHPQKRYNSDKYVVTQSHTNTHILRHKVRQGYSPILTHKRKHIKRERMLELMQKLVFSR